MSKTFTATEFMVEFGRALAEHGVGGPDPRHFWQVGQPMNQASFATGADYPTFWEGNVYRWTPGSPFAPPPKRAAKTPSGKHGGHATGVVATDMPGPGKP